MHDINSLILKNFSKFCEEENIENKEFFDYLMKPKLKRLEAYKVFNSFGIILLLLKEYLGNSAYI